MLPPLSWSAKYSVSPDPFTSAMPTPVTLRAETVADPLAPAGVPLPELELPPQPAIANAAATVPAPSIVFHHTWIPPSRLLVIRAGRPVGIHLSLRMDGQLQVGAGELDRRDVGDPDRQRVTGDAAASGHGADALRVPLAT